MRRLDRKIRDAEVKKVPYMLIVGEREAAEGKVSVRRHGKGDLGSLLLDEFVTQFKVEAATPL
jgi:threonyl-tRNA synthetase